MLSVITVTFNNFSELEATLKSLEKCTVQKVIINGGGCPETGKFLSTTGNSDSILSLSERDEGISDAFNKGLRLATGEAVVYLNSGDVLIDLEYYGEAMQILQTRPDVSFVYGDLCFVDQYAGTIRTTSGHQLPSMPFLHPTLIVRKNVFDKIGGFSKEYKIAMDLDFAYRLVNSGAKGYYIPRMVVRMDGKGVSSTKHLAGFKEVYRIIVRNRDFSFRSAWFLFTRGTTLVLKLLILKLKLSRLLSFYRKFRYRIRS